jgi:hypothetical protein
MGNKRHQPIANTHNLGEFICGIYREWGNGLGKFYGMHLAAKEMAREMRGGDSYEDTTLCNFPPVTCELFQVPSFFHKNFAFKSFFPCGLTSIFI